MNGAGVPNSRRIDRQQSPGLLVGRPPHHHAIEAPELSCRLLEVADAAIEHDHETGMRRLEPLDPAVVERRKVAVLARREPTQPGLAGVHDERVGARLLDRPGQRLERLLRILIIDADPALDRDRYGDRRLHGGNAVTDQLRLGHQTRAEAALLHALGGTPDIEVDLIVAVVRDDARARGQLARIAAAQLDRDRMLGRIEGQKPGTVAVEHRAGGDHLGIDQRAAGEQTMEEPAVPIGPFHHRRD